MCLQGHQCVSNTIHSTKRGNVEPLLHDLYDNDVQLGTIGLHQYRCGYAQTFSDGTHFKWNSTLLDA